MREEILALLEQNSEIEIDEIIKILNKKGFKNLNPHNIKDEIKRMKDEEIICGYSAIINWDRTEKSFVTALIEVQVTPQRGDGFDRIAERILCFPEVKSVYLMSGRFDLTVIVEGKDIKEVAFFVSDKLSTINSVIGTSTHFVLKNYKDHGIVMGKNKKLDERMIVSL